MSKAEHNRSHHEACLPHKDLHVLGRDTNKEIYEKICEMRAAYKAENDKYWEDEKAFREWYKEERKRKCVSNTPTALRTSLIAFVLLASPLVVAQGWGGKVYETVKR